MAEVSMVERIAQAIYASTENGIFAPLWNEFGGDKDYFHEQARIILAVMRYVDAGSPAMLVAGKKALFSCSEDPELEDARGCYQAMIDAALSEQGRL